MVSADLIHWRELPEVLLLAKAGEPDSGACGTGSVIEREGISHIFYLGRVFHEDNSRTETICHATSDDLMKRNKDSNNPVLVPDIRLYGATDWRDPEVNHPIDCHVFVHGTVVEVFLGGTVSLVSRIYDPTSTIAGPYVEKGEAYFENLRLSARNE